MSCLALNNHLQTKQNPMAAGQNKFNTAGNKCKSANPSKMLPRTM